MLTTNDTIEYLFYTNPKKSPEGYTVPGWYFWNEIWCDVYGPYETVDMARQEFKRYCKEVL